MMKLTDEITAINGIGPKGALKYNKLGIITVDDLIHYYPKEYVIYEKPGPVGAVPIGGKAFVYCRVLSCPEIIRPKKGLTITTIALEDERGVRFNAVYYNQEYLKSIIKTGQVYVLVGKKSIRNKKITLENPERFSFEEYKTLTGSFVPVYPLTKGLTRKGIINAVKTAFDGLSDTFTSELGEESAKTNNLIPLGTATKNIHFPKNEKEYLSARRRLAFEEFFVFLKKINELKQTKAKPAGSTINNSGIIDKSVKGLPYELTGAQIRAVNDCLTDMYEGRAMNRLLQGDVGSGKTIVAFLLMLEAAENGYQSILMAPTEVLAEQHYNGILKVLAQSNNCFGVALLTGSVKGAARKEVYEKIASGQVKIIIGTHALFQEKVIYSNVALVITDEQHRFGVRQREALENKGTSVHHLCMSATPIPRSLAGILYADMDVSVLDEKPKNRLAIKSCVVTPDYHERAYSFIKKEIDNHHQIYVICTLVEESEEMSGLNVCDYTKTLSEKFAGHRVCALHGRMSSEQKNDICLSFARGEIDVLVSTTVVEVGIDVPNATVIMIEDAQKFGLATLHQLRGRVGRGQSQSYCIFVDSSGDKGENERLNVMNGSEDGFYIASEDLRMRGPGDLFGVRQSGELNFRIADICRDSDLLMLAGQLVKK